MAINTAVQKIVLEELLNQPRPLKLLQVVQIHVNTIGSQVAAGSTLQNAVVRLAQYRANTPRDTTGLCECSGGNGHCTGCAAIPVYQTKVRVPGEEGAEGRRGDVPAEPLFSGIDGQTGEATIIVTSKTAQQRSYRSRFQLELVDFDVEDENEDGVFEPGEHIFIRRIRVKNTGGMPSPTKETRLEIDPSECLQPINTHEGQAFVPSVLPGQIITLPGSIKVLIREPDMPILGGEAYKESTLIKLKAIMPGLNRRLDCFEYQKSIEIQYPLELRELDYLDSVAQGSVNKFTMQIHNKSIKPFGGTSVSPRLSEIKISMPSETGSLLTVKGMWGAEAIQDPGAIKPTSSVELTQMAKISHLAKDHTYAEIHIEFYISHPGPVPSTGKKTARTFRMTQSFDLRIQISAAHIYDEEAGVLVITNAKTAPNQFEALGNFIRGELNLKMDVWNVSLYGGLVRQDEDNEEDEEVPNNILNDYRGRTIIFLGNKFEHFGVKEQTILNLCESRVIAAECFAGSSCLLLGAAAERRHRDEWMRGAVFPISYRISELEKRVAESSIFENSTTFITSICEQKAAGTSVSRAYILESNPKWYHGSAKTAVKLRAKQIRRHLRSKLPQERFWVCPIYPRADGARPHNGYVAVWHGLPARGNILAAESKPLERGQQPKLHAFESFNIVSALPCLLRIRLLCSFDREQDNGGGLKGKDEGTPSIDSDDPASYSHETLNAVQYSLEEDVCNEINNYLSAVPLINNIALGSKTSSDQFKVHFPCLETILQQIGACEGTPVRAFEVLKTAMAAANPQKKRQVAREFTIPFGQRRGQLQSYLTKRVEGLLRDKGYGPDQLKAFHASIRHSRFSSTQRNTGRIIEARNVQFTGVYTEEYRKGRKTTQDLVPKTVMCTAAEWDAKYQEIERTQHRLKRSVTKAFEKRAKMSTLKLDGPEMAASSA
ncbi:hypothetical protein N431DRAFT_491158 [Stipitochalara longipes BDJ]|nr:hypothetical protein N431DRAFT_491158 [Stipitochalara longipes BDJ]